MKKEKFSNLGSDTIILKKLVSLKKIGQLIMELSMNFINNTILQI